MATNKWATPAAIATALTTGLDSLANAANAISGAIDNLTGLNEFIDIEVVLASVDLSAQTNPAIYIWFVKQIDGSNYEDGGAAVNPARQPDIIVPLRAVNGAQRVIVSNVVFPPYSVELLWGNRTGAAHASSGNTLKYRLHNTESV